LTTPCHAPKHDLVVAARNAKDFAGIEVEILNPWEHLAP